MGMGLLKGFRCSTNYTPPTQPCPAPNPDPSRCRVLEKAEFENGYVLKVHYYDCTNFEGIKVMVYQGQYDPFRSLDPHFQNNDNSPVARFKPDAEGWLRACNLARSFTSNGVTTVTRQF